MLSKRKSVSDKKGGDCGNKIRKEKKEILLETLTKELLNGKTSFY